MDKRRVTVGSLIPKQPAVEPVTPSRHPRKTQQDTFIRLQQNKHVFDIKRMKGNLLNTSLKQGKPLEFKCRKGTCGVCTVKIIEGASHLLPPNEKEQKKLQHALTEGYRLACQAELQ
ncbi:2Fe-2S iron-sulfur cluster-binding protein [Bacillus sp. B190/17]|uniref:2Fe-2S iron-sulfur cluster-binding protein n=1 Tax=Bacillus lumedeiriae TaxID=3058829 RepID=A0ABW8I5V2_9BACI